MEQFYQWLVHNVTTNEFFAGGIVMGVIGYLAIQARSLPKQIAALIYSQFSTEITIRSTDGDIFINMARWLATHKDRRRARKLGIIHFWIDREVDDPMRPWDRKSPDFDVTFGFGTHLIWEGMMPILVRRDLIQNEGGSSEQELHIRTIGRSHSIIHRLVEMAAEMDQGDPKINIMLWGGTSYKVMDHIEARPMDSLTLEQSVHDLVVQDLSEFMVNKQWYVERNIPYRRGYLFKGPPGTGKSSLALAMSGMAGKSLHIINVSSVGSDTSLMDAVNQANAGVVLFEDVDVIEGFSSRKEDDEKKSIGVTMSGVLNAIDGVAAKSGRILIMTTNHPERLDPAIVRPGRIDIQLKLDLMGRELGERMFRRFHPGENPEPFLDSVAWPISPADCQGRLLVWNKEGNDPVHQQTEPASPAG
jgi:chaperone BCS1